MCENNKNGFYRYENKIQNIITYEYMEARTARLKGYTKEKGWSKVIEVSNEP